ncbi:Dirigent protein 21 [Raphanus sativus]|nr:Dirigent protein 21 [Raphanus sativus]
MVKHDEKRTILAVARLVLLPLFSALLLATAVTTSEAFSKTVKAPYHAHKPKKLTHLHFYFHDIVPGAKPTAAMVAAGPNTKTSASGRFGMVVVIDDPLTVGPEITSEEVGRAQGMYASADQKSLGLLMAINLVFTKDEFAGSTASLYGRNPIMSKVREMPIIAGTGAFRFGRGYAQSRTFTFNSSMFEFGINMENAVKYNKSGIKCFL